MPVFALVWILVMTAFGASFMCLFRFVPPPPLDFTLCRVFFSLCAPVAHHVQRTHGNERQRRACQEQKKKRRVSACRPRLTPLSAAIHELGRAANSETPLRAVQLQHGRLLFVFPNHAGHAVHWLEARVARRTDGADTYTLQPRDSQSRRLTTTQDHNVV